MNQKILITIGSLAAMGAGYSIYANVQQGKKDELSSLLLREIRKVIEPSSSGLMAENAFSIHYQDEVLKKVAGKVFLLSKSAAFKMAQEIHQAFGAWWQGGDDENKLYGIFRKLRDKVQVSQVASAYYELHKVNLIDKLYDKLENKEVTILLGIVKKLPPYKRQSV